MSESHRPHQEPNQEPQPEVLASPDLRSTPEFDTTKYPDKVSGFAMPSHDEGIVEVEIKNSLDELELVQLPAAAVHRLNMPKLQSDAPAGVKEPFEAGIGLAIIACKVDARQGELARIILPTPQGDKVMLVGTARLVRKPGQT